MRLLTVTMLLVAITGTTNAHIKFEINVEQHLQKLVDSRYPIEQNKANRDKVREYIADRLNYYGLDVEEHKFNTTVTEDPQAIYSTFIEVEGTNVIGIRPAVTTHPEAVVLVGADYDSDGVSNPLFQNGAGVAALLETARLYALNEAWSGRYVANFTTIFVFFDINTRHHKTSPGKPGGLSFINEWLLPYMKNNPKYFGGAIIFDSIMNVIYEPNTQNLGSSFDQMFPKTFERVEESDYKGDFLCMVSHGRNDATLKLRDQFSANYNKDRRQKPYRLEDMYARDGMPFVGMMDDFMNAETFHFWTYKNDSIDYSQLPALLLTDTFGHRNIPHCEFGKCRPKDLLTEERLTFIEATIEATTRFLFNRQATLLPNHEDSGSSVASLSSALGALLTVCLARLYF